MAEHKSRFFGPGLQAAAIALLVGATRLHECCEARDLEAISCELIVTCNSTVYPDLSPEESRCIRALSCTEVREASICERLAARENGDPSDDADGGLGEVCP